MTRRAPLVRPARVVGRTAWAGVGVALAVTTLTVMTGCGNPLSRSGADVEPVTLTATLGLAPNSIGGDVLDRLIDATRDEAVRVVVDGRPDVGDVAAERHAVQGLRRGDADITVVRAGVLQMLGASSLAPLGAPLLVTNDEQAAAIAADPGLRSQLLSGLDRVGLFGLGLVPGGLRHPFAFGDAPLKGPGDYRGQVINVRPDAAVAAMLDQLGATGDHSINSERVLASGIRLRGIEVSVQQVGAVTLPAVQTANVTLYERFDVPVVRRQTWDGLTSAQQEDLSQSLRRAVGAATAGRLTEEAGQQAWCSTPEASSVLASPAELADLRATLAPVTHRITADADAARAVARIRELHTGTTDPQPAACGATPRDPAGAYYVTATGDQSVLDGLWRLEVDEQHLLDVGMSAQDAAANAGVWEFRITDGYADGTQPDGRRCNALFAFDGDQVSVDFGVRGVEDCGGVALGTYRLTGDRVFFAWRKELEYDVRVDQAMFAPGMARIR